MPPEQVSGNYVCFYIIRPETENSCEYTLIRGKLPMGDDCKVFDKPDIQEAFTKMLQCHSADELKAVPKFGELVDALVKLKEAEIKEIDAYNSLVMAVIDGTNNHWQCGVWCYKPGKGVPLEIHPVDLFCHDGLAWDDSIPGWRPIFD